MDIDLQKLKELAKKATPGPWRTANPYHLDEHDDIVRTAYKSKMNMDIAYSRIADGSCGHLKRDWRGHFYIVELMSPAYADNAAYIAAASPDVILAMIQRIEELQAQVQILKNELERVKE